MVMIKLSMMEDEYGEDVTLDGPGRKEYVGGRVSAFIFVESLLYLILCVIVFLWMFLDSSFFAPIGLVLTVAGILAVGFVLLTMAGTTIVKRFANANYDRIKRVKKDYADTCRTLMELLDNEA